MTLIETTQLMGNIGEFVGAIAVVVTLAYLAVQVRQNTSQIHQATEVSRGTAELETAKMNMSYFQTHLDPVTAAVWKKAYADPENMTDQERTHFASLMAIWFHLAQGHYRQYQRGLLPEESWEPIARTLAGAMRQDVIQRWWSKNVFYLATDFRSYVDGLATEYADDVWLPEHGF
jgi:hypothetical protein